MGDVKYLIKYREIEEKKEGKKEGKTSNAENEESKRSFTSIL